MHMLRADQTHLLSGNIVKDRARSCAQAAEGDLGLGWTTHRLDS